MNKAHRVVWSESRGAFIVAHEYAATSGKRSNTKSVIAHSLAVAALVAAAAPALAQTTLSAGQSLNNPAGTTIQGANGSPGVIVSGVAAGAITNSGTISSAPTAGTSSRLFGVFLSSAALTGGITNSGIASVISGAQLGVKIQSGSSVSTIINAGHISGGNSGVDVLFGSTLGSLINTGTISGVNFDGVIMETGHVTAGITNSGVISGATRGLALFSGSTVSGGITNSGLIVGSTTGVGLIIGSDSTVSGGIHNLSGGVISGASGIVIYNGSVVDSITNAAGATISGSLHGGQSFPSSGGALVVYESTVTGQIVNAGVITGNARGIQVFGAGGAQSAVIGGLSNSGLIHGVSSGVLLYGATVTGAVANSGTISSVNGVGLFSRQSTISGGIQNLGSTATISGSEAGVYLFDTTVHDGIVNSGTMAGGELGLLVAQSTVTGGVSNLSGGVFSGEYGLYLERATVDSVSNAGTISGLSVGTVTGFDGIGLQSGGNITGQLTNSGLITGGNYGLNASASTIGEGIFNSGTITGSMVGIALSSFSTVSGGIHNSGLIHGGSAGILIGSGSTVTGGIVNSGTISSDMRGIYVEGAFGGFSGGISNSGLIQGTTIAGIYATNGTLAGGIANASGGTITGAEGIFLNKEVSDSISNAAGGSILGQGSNAIELDASRVSGSLTNGGAIMSAAKAGILVTASTIAGSISNAGTISGGTRGISVGGASAVAGLSNSGTISGGSYAVNIDATSTLGAITISGNSAKFVGDVYSPSSAVSLTSGSTFTGSNAFNVASFDVASGALLNMNAMASTAAEAAGITASAGVTNEGTLGVGRTSATITGSYTQAASGAFSLGAASNTDYGHLNVTGAANLAPNARIAVDIASNATLANHETLAGVLIATNLTASTFNVTDNSDLISFKGLIVGNQVDLVTSFNALVLPDVLFNKNVNAIGSATVLDDIILSSNGAGPFSGVINDIAKLQTSRQVSDAASQTLPLLSGDYNVATYAAVSQMNQVVQSRLEGHYGMSSGVPYLSETNAWVKPFGSWADAGNQNGAPGFSSGVEGVALGGDGAVSNAARVGLAFAYANVDVSGNATAAPNNDRINMYQLMGYGSYALDAHTEVNAQLDGGINTNDGHRSIAFAGESATSNFNSSDAHFGIGIARELPLSDSTVFTPQVRVDYTWISSDGYTEGGAGPLSLQTQSTSLESLLTQVNGKLTQKFTDYLTVFGNFGIGYDSMTHDNTSVVAAFTGAPGLSFTTEGVGLKPRVLMGGIGMVSSAHGNMPEVSLRYDLQQREGFADQSVSFKARWAF